MPDGHEFDCLKIENQLCFPLYACAKEVVRRYKPFLDEVDLTYTQYIAMMILWDRKEVTVKALGECLYLDSGTLTPLLKKLESKGLIRRHRSNEDERNLLVTITDEGMALPCAHRGCGIGWLGSVRRRGGTLRLLTVLAHMSSLKTSDTGSIAHSRPVRP